jgi:small-conductance mechanosensitive channel
MFDRPFRRGDTIRYGNTTGTVERIGLKTTRMRGVGGEQVIMANTKLLEQELHNLAEAKVRRMFLPFALSSDTPADTLAALQEVVAPALAPIKSCRLVRCVVTKFGAGTVDAELVYDDRTSEPDVLARHKSAIIIAVLRIFAERGIELAAAPAPPSPPGPPPKP